MLNSKKRRLSNVVNAGLMADIAFLLLIFFLVTTTIASEMGLRVLLPPWDEETKPTIFHDSSIFNIKINAKNELLFENKVAPLPELKENIKTFVQRQRSHNLPAIISLQNDRGTNYEIYLGVYDRIKAAFFELREAAAQKEYHKAFKALSAKNQGEIKELYPMVISEAEPTVF